MYDAVSVDCHYRFCRLLGGIGYRVFVGNGKTVSVEMNLKFLKSVLIHKWYVFLAGLKTGVPVWRLIVHDWQKFTHWEFREYARKFFGKRPKSPVDKIEASLGFSYAWLHHENTAPHHWGYWIPRSGRHDGKPLPMPETYVREMVADWMGASRAYTGSWNMAEWLSTNGPRMEKKMHPETVRLVHDVLIEQNYIFTDNAPWICHYTIGKNWM